MDLLTGFSDRSRCMSEAGRLVQRAREHQGAFSAIWIGLDRFSQVNESLGMQEGDAVLSRLSQRMARAVLRSDHLWARVGGDEFVLLLPGVDGVAAETIAEDILGSVEMPLSVGYVKLHPSCSLGVAVLQREDEPVAVLERANRAMIAAKQLGGGRCVVSGEEHAMSRASANLPRVELLIEQQLHDALEGGNLTLHYQPVVRIADGSLEAFEALMRCRNGRRLLPPSHFIPVAEKTGLIIRLGEWSLLAVARLVKSLEQRGREVKVAVNVSRAQLTAPRFVETLHRTLSLSGANPAFIELELTESLFMDASAVVRRNLDAACEAGFPLAIDDFGTGYSCLAYLKDLPAKKLKLDRAFVLDLPHDRKAYAIARTITQLANDLGMVVVAEGVETREQYESLREMGVTAVQGFLLARPMDEADVAGWRSA